MGWDGGGIGGRADQVLMWIEGAGWEKRSKFVGFEMMGWKDGF